jgi:hypothetical protein
MEIWNNLKALKGKTLIELDGNNKFDIISVSASTILIYIHKTGKNWPIPVEEVERAWQKLKTKGIIYRSEIEREFAPRNTGYFGAILENLIGINNGLRRQNEYALLKPTPKVKPPRQAGVREEDARLANDPPPPIIWAISLGINISEEVCRIFHKFATGLKIHNYPFNPNEIPMNGIYIMFEKGELAHGGKRIVRVGTHTGKNQLRKRLEQHFTRENKDRSIFRKNIGRALLTRDKDPFLQYWELDLTNREARNKYEGKIDRTKQASVERQVTDYIQKNISFVVIEILDKDQRLELEAQMISTVFNCHECRPSSVWLGLHSPIQKIREGGLWNVNELKGGRNKGGLSIDYAALKPPPKTKPPRHTGVREEDAREEHKWHTELEEKDDDSSNGNKQDNLKKNRFDLV